MREGTSRETLRCGTTGAKLGKEKTSSLLEKKGRKEGGKREGRYSESEAWRRAVGRAGSRADGKGRARSEVAAVRRSRHHSASAGEPETAFDQGTESEAWQRKKLWL